MEEEQGKSWSCAVCVTGQMELNRDIKGERQQMERKIEGIEEYKKRYAGERYYTLNQYLREQFGEKVYKLALDGGMSCPNRDGTLGYGGCIFCSGGGSGEFAEKLCTDVGVTQQIERAKMRICQKTDARKFIAYFQSYTNTYAPVEYLRRIFTEAISHPEVAVLSIATRPDCLPPAVVSLLAELNQIKPVWVELGLQTIHAETAAYIRRGYDLRCYEEAVIALRKAGIEVVTHVILGLPGESPEDILETVRYLSKPIEEHAVKETLKLSSLKIHKEMHREPEKIDAQLSLSEICRNSGSQSCGKLKAEKKDFAVQNYVGYRTNGIKLQLLHVLKGTDLAAEYQNGAFEVLSMEQYLEILGACIRLLPPDMVVHRITGDGPKNILLAPEWSANKKYVLNTIRRYMKEQDIWQGKDYSCCSTR